MAGVMQSARALVQTGAEIGGPHNGSVIDRSGQHR